MAFICRRKIKTITKQSNGWFLSCIFAIPLRSILWQKCNLKTTVYRGVKFTPMTRTISSLFVVLLMLFAMEQWVVTSNKVAVLNEIAGLKTTESCAAVGGNLQSVCKAGNQMCVVPYDDAGKRCISGAQCDGECRVSKEEWNNVFALGRCSSSNNPCGCWASVEFGRVQQRICAD